jgi:hypothetical protein
VGGTSGGAYVVSRDTGHALVAGFQPHDFQFWYQAASDRFAPNIHRSAFHASGWEPILLSFGKPAAAWKADGRGHWCICQIDLADRIVGNPVAAIFAERLLKRDAQH